MADVEKRKSFADMKLVDFTSGFSNFEVCRKQQNPNPSHQQATKILTSHWLHGIREFKSSNESFYYLSLAWQWGYAHFLLKSNQRCPGKPGILWGLQWTQHRGKRGRGWQLPRRRRRRQLRQQQHCEREPLFKVCFPIQYICACRFTSTMKLILTRWSVLLRRLW